MRTSARLLQGLCAVLLCASAASRRDIVKKTIEGRSGRCYLLLTRQSSQSSASVLYVDLIGRGTRPLAATALKAIREGLIENGSEQVLCVVMMSRSRGATIMSLPPIASFIVAHGHELKPIIVLEARGAALAAVRMIKRLTGLNQRIRCYHSAAEFEAACATRDEACQQALRVVEAMSRHAEGPRWLQRQGREQWRWASSRLREQIDGALTRRRFSIP